MLPDLAERVQSAVKGKHHKHVVFSDGKILCSDGKILCSKDETLPDFHVPCCYFQLGHSFGKPALIIGSQELGFSKLKKNMFYSSYVDTVKPEHF